MRMELGAFNPVHFPFKACTLVRRQLIQKKPHCRLCGIILTKILTSQTMRILTRQWWPEMTAKGLSSQLAGPVMLLLIPAYKLSGPDPCFRKINLKVM